MYFVTVERRTTIDALHESETLNETRTSALLVIEHAAFLAAGTEDKLIKIGI